MKLYTGWKNNTIKSYLYTNICSWRYTWGSSNINTWWRKFICRRWAFLKQCWQGKCGQFIRWFVQSGAFWWDWRFETLSWKLYISRQQAAGRHKQNKNPNTLGVTGSTDTEEHAQQQANQTEKREERNK